MSVEFAFGKCSGELELRRKERRKSNSREDGAAMDRQIEGSERDQEQRRSEREKGIKAQPKGRAPTLPPTTNQRSSTS